MIALLSDYNPITAVVSIIPGLYGLLSKGGQAGAMVCGEAITTDGTIECGWMGAAGRCYRVQVGWQMHGHPHKV